jgi:hypothetical protein
LTVDEGPAQTRAIHALQRKRETLAGQLERRDRDQVLRLHQNAQRLLRPVLVANPFAETLTFTDQQTRTRRDHMKYLVLIRTIAYLHQHQRPVQTVQHRGQPVEYIEVTEKDLAIGNRLAHQLLGRSLDELPPQTRRLLVALDEMVTKAVGELALDRSAFRFSRRDVRERTGWGYTQVRVHLERLIALEYVLVHRGASGQSYVYELAYDGQGQDGTPFLPGLIDLRAHGDESTIPTLRGSEGDLAGALRPVCGPFAGPSRPGRSAHKPNQIPPLAAHLPAPAENAEADGRSTRPIVRASNRNGHALGAAK